MRKILDLNKFLNHLKKILDKVRKIFNCFFNFFKKHLGFLGFIISLAALLFTIYTFRYPKINIHHSPSLNPKDALKTPFVISNLGNSAIKNFSLIIKIDSLYASTQVSENNIPLDTIIDTMKFQDILPGKQTYFFVNLYDYIEKRPWSNAFSLDFGPGYPSDLSVKKAKIEFSLFYKWNYIYILPITEKERFNFISFLDTKKEIHWLPLKP